MTTKPPCTTVSGPHRCRYLEGHAGACETLDTAAPWVGPAPEPRARVLMIGRQYGMTHAAAEAAIPVERQTSHSSSGAA